MAYPFSKQILDRSTGTDKIVASTTTHGSAVAAALAAELASNLAPGEVMPDFGLVITLLGRHLDGKRVAMNQADQAHQSELADDPKPRADRDEVNVRIYARLVKTRELVQGLFGGAGERAVGFQGAIPENPRARIKLARFVASRVGLLGEPLIEGVQFDAEPTIAALHTDADELEGHMGQVDTEVREAEGTLLQKNADMAGYDTAFAADAAVIAGLYRLAGKAGLADRLRPSARRAGVTAEDAGEVEAGTEG